MRQVFRAKTAYVFGWGWLVFVAAASADLIVRYNGKPSLVALAVLGALSAAVYVVALRPATVLTEDGLLGRNPLRTTFVPWAAVEDTTVSYSINVSYGDGERMLRLWSPMASARERARAQRRGRPAPQRGRFRTEPVLTKAEQAAADALAGKTHADWVAEQITERAEAARLRRQEPGPARVSWAYDSIAVLAAAVVLIVVAALA